MPRIIDRGPDRPQRPQDPLVRSGLSRDTTVPIPLDFLQGLSMIAQRNLERRPPILPLRSKKRLERKFGKTLSKVDPLIAKDTSEIAYDVIELVMRRRDEVLASGDENAKRGLIALERICRMFEHIYIAQSTVPPSEAPL